MSKYCSEFDITSDYEQHIVSGRPGGIDYATPIGTPLKLFQGGLVHKSIDEHGGFYIYVFSGDRMWLYVHLSRYHDIKTGNLKNGEFFGYAGNTGWSTGAHTHVELRIDGKTVDPQPYIDQLLKEPMKKYRVTLEGNFQGERQQYLEKYVDKKSQADWYVAKTRNLCITDAIIKIYKLNEEGKYRTLENHSGKVISCEEAQQKLQDIDKIIHS
jgi:hypothetical protein